MALGPVGNTIAAATLIAVGLGIGVGFERVVKWINRRFGLIDTKSDPEPDSVQVPINAAILYLTLILALSSIVSQWPPEGQEMPQFLGNFVFFGGVLVASFIAGRVTRLIARLESSLVQ